MQRVLDIPRPNWVSRVEEQGLSYHTHIQAGVSVPYWFESAHYEFSMAEIDRIEQVTNDLQEMCIKAAKRIIGKGWITTRLALPEIICCRVATNTLQTKCWTSLITPP